MKRQARHRRIANVALALGMLLTLNAAAQGVQGAIQRPVEQLLPVVTAPPAAPAVPVGAPAMPNAEALPLPLPEVLPPGQWRDCPDCPLLVTLPAGEFRYGTPAEASEVDLDTGETPAHIVRLAKSFAMSRGEITVAQFAAFAAAVGQVAEGRCQAFAGSWVTEDNMDWQSAAAATLASGAPANLPVTCVSWDEARTYVEWLSTTTGHKYRLPSEVEWEYAARAGTSAARSFSSPDPLTELWLAEVCDHANVYDIDALESYAPSLLNRRHATCHDGAVGLMASGHYAPNAFALVDLIGNAREWVQDCQTTSRRGAPFDGRAWEWSGCGLRGIRGGSFLSAPSVARSAARERAPAGMRAFDLGFRVVRDVEVR